METENRICLAGYALRGKVNSGMQHQGSYLKYSKEDVHAVNKEMLVVRLTP